MSDTQRLNEELLKSYTALREGYIAHAGTGCDCRYCKGITEQWMRKRPFKKPRAEVAR